MAKPWLQLWPCVEKESKISLTDRLATTRGDPKGDTHIPRTSHPLEEQTAVLNVSEGCDCGAKGCRKNEKQGKREAGDPRTALPKQYRYQAGLHVLDKHGHKSRHWHSRTTTDDSRLWSRLPSRGDVRDVDSRWSQPPGVYLWDILLVRRLGISRCHPHGVSCAYLVAKSATVSTDQ